MHRSKDAYFVSKLLNIFDKSQIKKYDICYSVPGLLGYDVLNGFVFPLVPCRNISDDLCFFSFIVDGVSPSRVIDRLRDCLEFGGIGYYSWWPLPGYHIDDRNTSDRPIWMSYAPDRYVFLDPDKSKNDKRAV